MQINNTVETEAGTLKFEGTLEGKELDVVIQLGLHQLIVQGLVVPKPYTPPQSQEEKPTVQ